MPSRRISTIAIGTCHQPLAARSPLPFRTGAERRALTSVKARRTDGCYGERMENVMAARPPVNLPRWRELVWPKEHGSWSLALEPLALGLLAAPSIGGGALAVAAMAGFFARRPLRIAFSDTRPARRDAARRAAVGCGAVALVGWFAALAAAGTAWWPWLLPSAAAGAFFLAFDLQQAGREQHAEIAGATAFACLTATLAAIAGWATRDALAIGAVMLVRAVPTVLTVRATIRARKTGVSRATLPLVAVFGALAAVVGLANAGLVPWEAVVLAAVLAARSFALLVFPRPALRASTIGMIEAMLGVAYVVLAALAWH